MTNTSFNAEDCEQSYFKKRKKEEVSKFTASILYISYYNTHALLDKLIKIPSII